MFKWICRYKKSGMQSIGGVRSYTFEEYLALAIAVLFIIAGLLILWEYIDSPEE